MRINRIINKIRSQAGESLSETLISLLVAALALTLLAGAVSSGANVITKSQEKLKVYYDDNETKIVQMSGAGNSEKKVTISSSGLENQDIPIVYYENNQFGDAKKVIAYKMK